MKAHIMACHGCGHGVNLYHGHNELSIVRSVTYLLVLWVLVYLVYTPLTLD